MTCWIVFNSGDPEGEFAECSVCGHEFIGWPYPRSCPKCRTRLERIRIAESMGIETDQETITGDKKEEIK